MRNPWSLVSVEESIERRNGWRFSQGFTCYFYVSRPAKVRYGVVETGECPKQGYSLFSRFGIAIWTKFWFEDSCFAHPLSFHAERGERIATRTSRRGILLSLALTPLPKKKGKKVSGGDKTFALFTFQRLNIYLNGNGPPYLRWKNQ